MIVPAAAAEKPVFTDVVATAWYADAVQYASQRGYLNGVGNNMFDPEGTVSRGQLVTVLYRMDGATTVGANPFYDVQPSMYFRNPVTWAYKNGIVSGLTSTSFAPHQNVSREQMALILYRYAKYKGMDTSKSKDLSSFTDSAMISSYTQASLKWATANGIIAGTSGNLLDPQGNVSRAQLAIILQRFQNLCENKIATVNAKPAPVTASTVSATKATFDWPVKGYVSSEYGYRTIFGEYKMHYGIDIAAPTGTKITAAASGKVTFSGEKGSYGNLVIIDHGNGYVTYYGHNSELKATVGSFVNAGDVIALCGATGNATGPHCHFEVRINGSCQNPRGYLKQASTAVAMLPSDLVELTDLSDEEIDILMTATDDIEVYG